MRFIAHLKTGVKYVHPLDNLEFHFFLLFVLFQTENKIKRVKIFRFVPISYPNRTPPNEATDTEAGNKYQGCCAAGPFLKQMN